MAAFNARFARLLAAQQQAATTPDTSAATAATDAVTPTATATAIPGGTLCTLSASACDSSGNINTGNLTNLAGATGVTSGSLVGGQGSLLCSIPGACDANGNPIIGGTSTLCSIFAVPVVCGGTSTGGTGTGTNTMTNYPYPSYDYGYGYGHYRYHYYNRCYYRGDWYRDCYGDDYGHVTVKVYNKYEVDQQPMTQVQAPKGGVNTGDGSVG